MLCNLECLCARYMFLLPATLFSCRGHAQYRNAFLQRARQILVKSSTNLTLPLTRLPISPPRPPPPMHHSEPHADFCSFTSCARPFCNCRVPLREQESTAGESRRSHREGGPVADIRAGNIPRRAAGHDARAPRKAAPSQRLPCPWPAPLPRACESPLPRAPRPSP